MKVVFGCKAEKYETLTFKELWLPLVGTGQNGRFLTVVVKCAECTFAFNKTSSVRTGKNVLVPDLL